jgi:hypothetical protein
VATIDLRALFETAKTASYEALPVGDYPVEIFSADAVTSSNGKPMIKVKLKVLSGPHANRQIFNQFVLSTDNANALAIFFRHMRAFGLNEQYIAGLGVVNDLSPLAQALLGRQAVVTLGHREWQGETRNEVNGIKPLTGAVGAPGAGALPGSQPLPGPAGPGGPAVSVPLPVNQPTPVPAPVTPAAAPVIAETATVAADTAMAATPDVAPPPLPEPTPSPAPATDVPPPPATPF